MKPRLTAIAAVATVLSSIGLHPLFNGWFWFPAGAGAVAVTAVAGLLTRRFRLPAAVCVAAGLAALNLYVTAGFTSSRALLFAVPTPASMGALADLIGQGWRTSHHYHTPVPLTRDIMLLAVLGIGMIAVIVDFLAVRLRRAAPAGLPLLAMYSVPAALRQESVGWLTFVLGAAGFMVLLLADAQDQVGGWGRHVGEPTGRPAARALAGTGGRIGLAALALAVLVPIVTPGVHPNGLLGFGVGAKTEQGGNVETPRAFVSMRQQLLSPGNAVVLTYQTNDPDQPDYLRMFSLDTFDGNVWTQSGLPTGPQDRVAGRDLPAPAGLSAGTPARRVTTRVRVPKTTRGMTFLAMPYAPARVDVKGDWRFDDGLTMVFSLSDSAGGGTYTVTSTRALPTPAELTDAGTAPTEIARRYTEVPPDLPPRVAAKAREITRKADGNPYEAAVLLEDWFADSGQFTYDVHVDPPRNVSNLEDFLFVHRTGYCEQFAASMAIMARLLGIPARVAVGYTSGHLEGNDWVVRSNDAHAWPELYFAGAGWVRFEPTPGGAAGQGSATVPAYAEPPVAVTPVPGATATATVTAPAESPVPGADGHHIDGGAQGATSTPAKHGAGLPVGWISLAVLLCVLLSIPMAVRLATRRRRWSAVETAGPDGPESPGGWRPTADPPAPAGPMESEAVRTAHAAWAELRADALDHGLPWEPAASPRATAHLLAETLELDRAAADALDRLYQAEERALYARSPATPGTLRADVRTMRETFAAGVGRATRLRARLAPPTAMASMRSAAGEALGTADRLWIRLWVRLRGRFRPPPGDAGHDG